MLADVLAALDGIDSKLAGAAVDNILAWPGSYDPDAVLVPAVLKFREADGSAAILRLRTACVVHLRLQIAEPLAPPRTGRAAVNSVVDASAAASSAGFSPPPRCRPGATRPCRPSAAM
jgi:hypothetical protein